MSEFWYQYQVTVNSRGISIVMEDPQARWRVHLLENPRIDENWGYPHDFGNPQLLVATHLMYLLLTNESVKSGIR